MEHNKLLTEMGWDTVENVFKLASSKITHQILLQNVPEIVSHWIKSKLPPPQFNTRQSGAGKIGPRPANIGLTRHNV